MEQQFNLRWYIRALGAASRACSHLGRWDYAVEAGQKALNVAEEFSNNSLISFAAWSMSIAYTWKGDLDQAVEYGSWRSRKPKRLITRHWGRELLHGLGAELERQVKELSL